MERDDLLWQYCDLTEGRYWALVELDRGSVQRINGAMRTAMGNLVNEEHQITAEGRKVLARADDVLCGLVPGSLPYKVKGDTATAAARAARWMRKNGTGTRWTTAHTKILLLLVREPEASYKYLIGMYGWRVMDDLLEFALVAGEKRTGMPFNITADGLMTLELAGVIA
jgi:hypothetical protein